MPEANFLSPLWDTQCNTFRVNLESIRKRPAGKNIHDLRVSFKKLKSVIHLVSTIPEEDIEGFTDTRQFFRITGKYRDTAMSLSLINRICKEEKMTLPAFSDYLRNMCAITKFAVKESAVLPVEVSLGQINTIVKKQLEEYTEEELIRKIETAGAAITEETEGLLEEFTKNAHTIRIKLKDLFYWLNHCPVNPFYNKKQMRSFDKVLTALGKWHDYLVLRNKLRYFRKEYLAKDTSEYEQAVKMEEVLLLIKQQWLANAADKIKKPLFK